MNKVIVAGGRYFNDYELLKNTLDNMFVYLKPNIEIVSGKARGADSLGERYAHENGFPVKEFTPDWDSFGKSAGYRRNADMADYADFCVVFWDGKSKGSKHMIDLAESKGLQVRTIYYME